MDSIKIGESEYVVIKTGRAQAAQVLALSKWITKHGVKAMKNVKAENVSQDNFLNLLTAIIDNLTTDALIDLFVVVTGCTAEEAELYFDISILIEVIVEIYEKQPAVKRLIERFFSASPSEVNSEE